MAKVKGIDDALNEGVETNHIHGEQLDEYLNNLKTKHKINAKANDSAPVRAPAPRPMSHEAFSGLAGEVVRQLAPHTESDKHAILLQFLTIFGNMVGSSPHYRVEQTRHGTKLYLLVVGESSKGRKGTSYNQCISLFEGIDGHWYTKCRASGLSSSEGLIYRVRDPEDESGDDEGNQLGANAKRDMGVSDKRLLVVESEFTSVLRNFKREGNKLSHTIREAFDGGILSTLVKSDPTTATNTHISIIGHVTKFEMLKHMGEVEIANGFANRFLFCLAKRSQLLPDGGDLQKECIELLRNQISAVVNFAKAVGPMKRDKEGQDLWEKIYPYLSEGDPGMFGAIIGRREALVLRLSVIYALLDHSDVISKQNLLSALAVWEYCEASARYFFGDKLGDQDADALLVALKDNPAGFTRTVIRDFFQRNKLKNDVERVISLLTDRGLAHWYEQPGCMGVLRYGPESEISNGSH